jgi:hypothetical protein
MASLYSPSQATEPQEVWGAATSGCTALPKSRQGMRPTSDYAASLASGEKSKTPLRGGSWSLDKGSPHKS